MRPLRAASPGLQLIRVARASHLRSGLLMGEQLVRLDFRSLDFRSLDFRSLDSASGGYLLRMSSLLPRISANSPFTPSMRGGGEGCSPVATLCNSWQALMVHSLERSLA